MGRVELKKTIPKWVQENLRYMHNQLHPLGFNRAAPEELNGQAHLNSWICKSRHLRAYLTLRKGEPRLVVTPSFSSGCAATFKLHNLRALRALFTQYPTSVITPFMIFQVKIFQKDHNLDPSRTATASWLEDHAWPAARDEAGRRISEGGASWQQRRRAELI